MRQHALCTVANMKELNQSTFRQPDDAADLMQEALVVHRHPQGPRARALLILVHGLGGNRYGKRTTWGKIPEFLFEDFPYLDLGMYEYRTLFRRFKLFESISLEEEARVFAGILREADYETILLAGHSMGGLLCMAVLCYFYESNQKEVLERIAGLLLMATPQTGSQRLPGWLCWFSRDFYALRPHGQFVTRVQRTITNAFYLDENEVSRDKTTVPTWALLGSSDFWVDRLSASLRLPDARCQSVRGSHTSIVKPAAKESDAYRYIRKCIAKCLSLAAGEKAKTSADSQAHEPLTLAGPLPSAGVVFNRQEAIKKVGEFFTDGKRKVWLLYGFPGIGKTALAARSIELYASNFQDVLWVECRPERATADVLFANFHSFLMKHDDRALAGIWMDARPDSLQEKISALIEALNRRPFLVVFDDFSQWLDAEFHIRDAAVRRVLQRIAATVHKAKVLLISRHRGLGDDFAFAPIGATVEQELLGLDPTDARELLEACGLNISSTAVLDKIVEYFSGNPGMLKIFARLVVSRHQEPLKMIEPQWQPLLNRWRLWSRRLPAICQWLASTPCTRSACSACLPHGRIWNDLASTSTRPVCRCWSVSWSSSISRGSLSWCRLSSGTWFLSQRQSRSSVFFTATPRIFIMRGIMRGPNRRSDKAWTMSDRRSSGCTTSSDAERQRPQSIMRSI